MKEQIQMSRYTTLGTGGPAHWFDAPQTVEELVDRSQSPW